MTAASTTSSLVCLKNNAWRLLAGTFTSALGSGVAVIASALLISNKTSDPGSIGLLFIAISLPQALLTFFAGRLTERFAPERMCLVSNLVCTAGAIWLAVLTLSGEVVPAQLYAFSFLFSACAAVIFPATNALIRHCITNEHLSVFSSRFEIALQSGSLISVALGGIAMDHFSPGNVFIFSALAYLLSGLLTGTLSYSKKAPLTNNNQRQEILLNYRPAGALLLYAIGSVIITVTNTLMVILIVQYFNSSATSLGIADALAGAGVIISALLYAQLHKFFSLLTIISLGYALSAVCIFFQPRFDLVHYLVLFPLGSLFYGFARIGCRQLIYATCSSEKTGRYFGYANAFGLVLSALVTLGVSSLVAHYNVLMGYAATSVFIVVGALISLCILRYKRVES
ncbi:MFS transporter [Serratia marcescens]|uniref:MFS transporter n=1 Tax=Serratia marcescens TaxID=615 RepID=UPI0011B9B43B|nr:MFS transporter [Serratia marcescens]MDP8726913.1 MFS transporter [Serratia marcescens]TWY33590.1 MFS transporter [Serratia marcescens]